MMFLFCFGACVGSFLNVVIYRLPAGMSVITPASRCPTCGASLRFFRENMPILGWLLIRGRCRYCKARVSCQYMLVELLMALIFVGLYLVLFATSSHHSWWGDVAGQWWESNRVFKAWPAYMAVAFLLAGLVAMTVIDARTFTIPIEIPLFVTIWAFIAYPLQAIIPHKSPSAMTWPIPGVDWQWCLTAFLGMAGVILALVLLRTGKLRYSFRDYDDYVEEGETLGQYPHARREMLVELVYLAPCIIGLIAGYLIGATLPMAGAAGPPEVVQALGASVLGYLSGCALIWGTRIIATLIIGREAMGLGDVHLMGAIGAVLGWFDPIVVFFLAPFSGIGWVLMTMGLSSVFRKARHELPYGPHLAVAAVAVILGRPALDWLLGQIMPGVPLPMPGLVP